SVYVDPHSFPTRRSSDLAAMPASLRIELFRMNARGCPFDGDFVMIALHYLRDPAWTKRNGINPAFVAQTIEQNSERTTLAHVFADRKSTRLNSSHVKISY